MLREIKIDTAKKVIALILDFDPTGEPSTSRKSMTHASTRGNVTTAVTHNGKPLVIGVNVYTSAK